MMVGEMMERMSESEFSHWIAWYTKRVDDRER